MTEPARLYNFWILARGKFGEERTWYCRVTARHALDATAWYMAHPESPPAYGFACVHVGQAEIPAGVRASGGFGYGSPEIEMHYDGSEVTHAR